MYAVKISDTARKQYVDIQKKNGHPINYEWADVLENRQGKWLNVDTSKINDVFFYLEDGKVISKEFISEKKVQLKNIPNKECMVCNKTFSEETCPYCGNLSYIKNMVGKDLPVTKRDVNEFFYELDRTLDSVARALDFRRNGKTSSRISVIVHKIINVRNDLEGFKSYIKNLSDTEVSKRFR